MWAQSWSGRRGKIEFNTRPRDHGGARRHGAVGKSKGVGMRVDNENDLFVYEPKDSYIRI